MEQQIKLTKQQNKVIWCLQQGWVLITNSDVKGAWVCEFKKQFHIDNGVFWRLVNKGLIYQEYRHHNYVLTIVGTKIKTKAVII